MSIKDKSKMLISIIGESIRGYFNENSLNKIYTYKFLIKDKYKKLFESDEIKRMDNSVNGFEKNILLKNILSEKINKAEDKLQYYNWIVKEWGGIKNFRKKVNEIDSFVKDIKEGKLNSKNFLTISSYSKIISFINPKEYFIFDSRVAYVLNWLLLKNYFRENSYFIVPPGRNSDLIKFNIDTIINLYDKTNPKNYYEKTDVYFIYCEFIKKMYEKIKCNIITEPYYIEMMLFGLFDKVCEEIKDRVEIIIGNAHGDSHP